MSYLRRFTVIFVWILVMMCPHLKALAETESVPGWRELTTVEDVCTRYPDLMKELVASLDLDRRGLEAAKQAEERGDIEAACEAVLAYYRDGNSASWLRRELPKFTNRSAPDVEEMLNDRFEFYGQADTVPRRDDGGLEWNHDGPSDDQEWAYALNRMVYLSQWGDAYFETGNPSYAKAIDAIIRDWVVHSHPYPKKKFDSAMWRGLEIHARAKFWSEAFFKLQASDTFRPATRLLMLQSLVDHAHYLRRFHSGNNWLTMELSGLAAIATRFPEFKASPEHLAYAGNVLSADLAKQVYPDGVQKELTAHYHWVALINFDEFGIFCTQAGLPLPQGYEERIVSMYDYLARSLRPDGTIPLNNDSDRHSSREPLLAAADRYGKPAWRYVATNGKEGKAPVGPPSRMYPYAGQLVSRNGWGGDAQWSFFDVGPLGLAHAHTDKLHLSVHVAGRDLLVDSGRFAYRGNLAHYRKQYGWHSRAHNVVLFDNRDQEPNPRSVEHPLSRNDYAVTEAFDYARSSVNHYMGLKPDDASHTRALIYVRGLFWVVVDRLNTTAPRTAETLWRWHPDCTVKTEGNRVFSADQGTMNLSIQPVGEVQHAVRKVKGYRKGADYQGWYSAQYNSVAPNTVTIYDANVNGQATHVWLLVPGMGDVPVLTTPALNIMNDRVVMQVTTPDARTCELVIPITAPANEASVNWKD